MDATPLPASFGTFIQIPLAQIQQLKEGFGLALAVLFMFGFFWGVIKIWSGANACAGKLKSLVPHYGDLVAVPD